MLIVVGSITATMLVGPASPARAGACKRGYVALTFDDGPSRTNAARLLQILEAKRAPATFFLTGRATAARPARARQIARAGHTIYNHTFDHADLTTLSNRRIRSQIYRTQRVLKDAGAPSSGRVMRPPYGAINRRVRAVLRRMGFRSNLWTIDTGDWARSTTSGEIVRRVARGLAPGANVLMHDQEDTYATLRALPRVINVVRRRGYCLGVVDQNGRTVRAR